LSSLYKKIDFEQELNLGRKAYDDLVGQWWYRQSVNSAHLKAYRTIVKHARSLFDKDPKVIIDYGCGPGHVLTRLYKSFPKSEIIGLDGSSRMLELTERRLQQIGGDFDKRVLLVETDLPNFSLSLPKADLLVFVFPNIVVRGDDQPYYDAHGYRKRKDRAVAKYLAHAREKDPEEETVVDEPEVLLDSLLTAKVISRNLRKLLRRGGACLRAEYSNADRSELTKLVQHRQAFEEGSLKKSLRGTKPKRLFKLLYSRYYRSKVIEDVYHQTRDESDKTGGYFLNGLKAV